MSLQEKIKKYHALCQAMQTGVAYETEPGVCQQDSHIPKHLRVGVNMAMCEQGAMAKLLVKKGIITEEEYVDAMIDMMEQEVKQYTDRIEKALGGAKITLA